MYFASIIKNNNNFIKIVYFNKIIINSQILIFQQIFSFHNLRMIFIIFILKF